MPRKRRGPPSTDAEGGGEASLWQAVLLQAFSDASYPFEGRIRRVERSPLDTDAKQAGAVVRAKLSEAEAHAARSWLLGFSKDFQTVCLMAGMEPSRVRSGARRQRAMGWPRMNSRTWAD